MMRSFISLFLLPLVVLFSACVIDPTAENFGLQPSFPFTSKVYTLVEDEPWDGESLKVHVEHGNVQVVGLRNIDTIRVRFQMYTFASTEDHARQMLEAQRNKFSFRREGQGIEVFCGKMTNNVKTASSGATQCNIRVEIPAPEGVVHDVQAYAENGFTYLNRLASGPSTQIVAAGVEVEGDLLRGNVALYSEWLDAEVEPIFGARIVLESTTGDWYYVIPYPGQAVPKRDPRDGSAQFGATLRIPKDFRAERVELFSEGAVEAFGFPDIQSGYPRGPIDETAAKLVSVKAYKGNATLLVWGEHYRTSRADEFGTDVRDPWTLPAGAH